MSKFDSGKPCFSLIEPNFALELAKVLTMGAEKYGPEDWKTTDNAHRRYLDALHRHLNAFERGQWDDPESGQSHLAHVAANAMFLHWLALNPQNDSAESVEMGCKNCVYSAVSNNLVTNNECVACMYYKNNGKGDNNFVVKDCRHPFDHAAEQLVIMGCDTCKWSSRPKGHMCKTCNYGDNYVKAPRFHGLLIYNPVHRSIEGDDNAEAVRSESASNMVDPVSCKCGYPGCPANDEEEPRDQGESESLVVILGLG